MGKLSPEDHKQRHIELHKALDELLADYINHHPGFSMFLKRPIGDLMAWAFEQTKNPDEIE